MKKYIKLPLVLGIVALVSGTLLATTYNLTKDTIEAGKIDRQTSAINDLFTNIESKELVEVPEAFKQKGIETIVKVKSNKKEYHCYTINFKDSLGGDASSIIIALDSDAKIYGVKFVSTGDSYMSKYNNDTYLANVVKNNQFDLISGASVSGNDLKDVLKLAIDCFKGNTTTSDPIQEMFTTEITSKEELSLPTTSDSKINKIYKVVSGSNYYVFDMTFDDNFDRTTINVLLALDEDENLINTKIVEGDTWSKYYNEVTDYDSVSGASFTKENMKEILEIAKNTLKEVK